MLDFRTRALSALGALVALGILLPERAEGVVNYLVDDGTINSAVGVGGSGGDLMLLNRFQVQPDGGSIESIQINWALIPNGTAAKLVVFNDPTNDGDLSDIVLLNQLDVTTQGGGGFNNNYADYVFPTTPVNGEFYVGAMITGMSGAARPWGYDTTDPDLPETSYFFEHTTAGTLDAANPNATSNLQGFAEDFITPGNFMIRAVGDGPIIPVSVPEPSSAALLLAGLLSLTARRRR